MGEASSVLDLKGAVADLSRPGRSTAEVDEALMGLISSNRKERRADLLDALSGADVKIFTTLRVIQATLALAEIDDRAPEFFAKFETFFKPGAEPPRWTPSDRIKSFKKQSNPLVSDYMQGLKYVGGPEIFETVGAATEFYAPRVDLPRVMVDTLFKHTVDKSLNEAEYLKKLRQGAVFDHVLNDLCRRRLKHAEALPRINETYQQLWSEDSLQRPSSASSDKSRPAIYLTFHCGMLDYVKLWFKTVNEDGVRLGSGLSDKIVSSKVNPNGALLEAYRFAKQGKSLLIAADSPMGMAKNSLTVLGRDLPIADGFVFLAFETRANVFWLVVVPENGQLVPKIVAGPCRESGEVMTVFRERMISFVELQLAQYFTGDPAQISVRSKWLDLLSDEEVEQEVVPAA